MMMANCSTDMIRGKVNLRITTEGATRTCEVRVAINLGTEFILDLDIQGQINMVFLSRSIMLFMPDLAGKHYPLNNGWQKKKDG